MIFRSKHPGRRATGLIFLAGAAASAGLALAYRWSTSNALVYYITMRPAYVWFGLALAALLVGAAGVKGRVVFAGMAIWFLCFCISEEILAVGRGIFGGSGGVVRESADGGGQGIDGTGDVPAVRVATWNISATPESIDAVLEDIGGLDADVVFLQECSQGDMLAIAMARHAPMSRYALVKAGDNAVMSRFAVSPVDDPRLSEAEGHACVVEVMPGVKVVCINVHFPPPALVTQVWAPGTWDATVRGEREVRERMGNLKAVVDEYAQAGPVILAGDFNVPGNFAGLRNATRSLVDSFLAAGHGWGKTVTATMPMSRIDMIYFSRHFKPIDCRAVGTLFSDHRPVVADAELAGQE